MRKLLRLRDTPHAIALGMSTGMFLGLSPLYGFHTVLAILGAGLTRGNRAAAVIGCWLNNPLTMLPLLYLQYRLGVLLLPVGPHGDAWAAMLGLRDSIARISLFDFVESMRRLGEAIGAQMDIFVPWLLGSLTSAVAVAFLVYPLTRYLVGAYRRRAARRRKERRSRPQAVPRAGGDLTPPNPA